MKAAALRAAAVALLAACLSGAAWSVPPATPALLRDLDPRPSGGGAGGKLPSQFVRAGARTVFALQATSVPGSSELWATDGTPAGTERLHAFSGPLLLLGTTGEVAFFTVPRVINDTYPAASLLWRTDGTRDGTFALGVLLGVDGSNGSNPPPVAGLVLGDALLFSGCTPEGGCELWRSDGTPEGTRRLREIVPGAAGSAPRGFAAFAGLAWFFADDPAGIALWSSDGTRSGTRRVLSFPPFASPRHLVVQGSRLYFTEGAGRFHGDEGPRLWTSDGTAAGTHLVQPFAGSRRGGNPQVIVLAPGPGDRAVVTAVAGKRDSQLWITDPDARSAHPLTHAPPAPNGGIRLFGATAAVAGRLLFAVDGWLWTSRGTGEGTRLDGCPGGCPAGAEVWGALPAAAGRVLFAGGSGASGFSLWTSDGTGAGTRKAVDLCPAGCDSTPALAGLFLGEAFFYFRGQLWVSDGSSAGTRPLADRPVTFADYGLPPPLYAAGGRAFFPALSAAGGLELWSTDGTPEGTRFLAGQEEGASSFPQSFFPFRGGALFVTCIDGQGELWSTDGTGAGTRPLPGAPSCATTPDSEPHPPTFVPLGEAAFFASLTADFAFQLWRTDGTPAGTFPIFVPAADESLEDIAVFRGKLLFLTSTETEIRFWESDGTPAGTSPLFSLPLATAFDLTVVGDRLLFVADNPPEGDSLWVSDGTAAGTWSLPDLPDRLPRPLIPFAGAFYYLAADVLVRTDLTPGDARTVLPGAQAPVPLFNLRTPVLFAGALYFLAQTGVQFDGQPHPFALYRSDGTARGTTLVRVIGDDPGYPIPTPMQVAGELLYFAAGDPEHGEELWRSDGTAAGTLRVADLQPGPGSSLPAELTAAGDRLFFTADDGGHGRELWVTRGAPGDPQPLGRRTDGTLSLDPRELTVAGDTLFFSADDGIDGREPWSLPLGPPAAAGGRR